MNIILQALVDLAKADLIRNDYTLEQIEHIDFRNVIQDIIKDPFPNLDKLNKLEGKKRQIQYPRLLLIKIEKNASNIYQFVNVALREYSTSDKNLIFLLDASGGNYISPTLKLLPTGAGKGKKLSNTERIRDGIIRALNAMQRFFNANFKEEGSEGDLIKQVIDTHFDDIADQLYEAQISIFETPDKASLNFNSVLSIYIDDLYVSELDYFLGVIERKMMETRFKFPQEPQNKRKCSLCGQESAYISGNVSPFSFYTTDKAGYIVGGFNANFASNNFPTCKNCAIAMEIGKRILMRDFSLTIGGEKCFLIPRNFGSLQNLSEFLDYYDKFGEYLENVKTVKKFRDQEVRLLDYLGELKDTIGFNFLFYELTGPSNSVFNILIHIQDVLPSRIKKIADAIESADNFDPHAIHFGLDTTTYPMNFSFRNLHDLFLREDPSKLDRRAYLEILWCIFIGNIIRFRTLIKRFFTGLNGILHDTSKDSKKSSRYPNTINLNKEISKILPIIYFFKILNQIVFKNK